MVLQSYDCVDVVKTIHPQYDSLFMFDYFYEHDKQRADSLNVENMDIFFGGKQSIMRESMVKDKKGYLATA